MRATLEFDLPDEACEYRYASFANDLAGTLGDIREYIRTKLKHSSDGMSRDAVLELENIRNMISDGIIGTGIDL